jgi:hypothetical protein
VEPVASIKKFDTLRARTAFFGSHVAPQRVFKNRQIEPEFAASQMPTNYTPVVLDGQKGIAVISRFILPLIATSRRTRIVLSRFCSASEKILRLLSRGGVDTIGRRSTLFAFESQFGRRKFSLGSIRGGLLVTQYAETRNAIEIQREQHLPTHVIKHGGS